MKITTAAQKYLFFAIVIVCTGFAIPQSVSAQTEKLGIVQYAPPRGMSKSLKENVVAFSEYDQATGKFCIITLYGATPGTGSPQSDFTREWNNLVIKTFTKATAKPETATESADGWTAVAGGSEVEGEVGKAVAFLTVISGLGKTVSVLGVFNDAAFAAKVEAFVTAIELDKPTAITNSPAAPQYENGKLIVPLPTRQLTIADLAGEWGEDAQRISTTYVDRSSGDYRGTDNLSFRSKMTFTRSGGYLNDFYEIRNGKKLIENTTGTFAINGRVLSIKQKGTAKYVIRGWLELPDMTILVVCGPWYDNDVIPAEIFTNPAQGANLNNTWVRKK